MRLLYRLFKSTFTLYLLLSAASIFASTYQPFLWKVQYQRATVYLAGSIHALTEDFYPLPSAYEAAFNEADRLAVELDPEALDPYRSAQIVRQKMWLPEGVTLETYLSKEHLKQLKQLSKNNDSNYQGMLKLRPWMLVEQLTQAQLAEGNYRADLGLDLHFLHQAKAKDMPILELETLSQQISAIADVTFQAQLAMLKTSLDQYEDQDYMGEMTEYWRTARPDALFDFVYQDVLKTPALKPMMDALLDKRNRHMADIIGLYLSQAPYRPLTTFVVVGALHLSGPNSVVRLLEEKGYYVQPMFDSY